MLVYPRVFMITLMSHLMIFLACWESHSDWSVLWNMDSMFAIQLGIYNHPNWRTHSFQRGRVESWNHQSVFLWLQLPYTLVMSSSKPTRWEWKTCEPLAGGWRMWRLKVPWRGSWDALDTWRYAVDMMRFSTSPWKSSHYGWFSY